LELVARNYGWVARARSIDLRDRLGGFVGTPTLFQIA
jgi:hypothetical protein